MANGRQPVEVTAGEERRCLVDVAPARFEVRRDLFLQAFRDFDFNRVLTAAAVGHCLTKDSLDGL